MREPVRILVGGTDIGFVRERADGRWSGWCRTVVGGRRVDSREKAKAWVRWAFIHGLVTGLFESKIMWSRGGET